MNREEIVRKVILLLAKSQGTDNVDEAQTFRDKVDEMIAKHGIKPEDLESDKMGAQISTFEIPADLPWMKFVVTAASHYFGAVPIFRRNWKTIQCQLAGRESCRVTAEMMIPYILESVKKSGKEMSAETGKTVGACIRDVGLALAVRIAAMKPDIAEAEKWIADGMPYVNFAKNKRVKVSNKAKDVASKISMAKQTTAKGAKQKAIS